MAARTIRTALVSGAAVLALFVACGPDAEHTGSDAPSPIPEPPTTADVVQPRLSALDRELVLDAPPEELDPEQVRGLVRMAVGRDRELRAAAREEVGGLGDAALPELLRILADGERPGSEREASIELCALLHTVRSATALLELLETSHEPWQRAHAAWRLAAAEQDWVVPRMLLRFKYEKDFDTVIWLAKTLAHYGNDTGLSVLTVVANASGDETLRASAEARREEIAAEAGAADAAALEQSWRLARAPALPQPTRSQRYDREVLAWIARFREFQLRGVDDARFVLERLGTRAAELLAESLLDQDLYTRLHSAQSLQRMGPRGEPAGPALLRVLGDPEIGPEAAEALGAIAYAPAEERLSRILLAPPRSGASADLRLACARALGGFGKADGTAEGSPPAVDALRASLAQDRPAELRQAAAESLCRRGYGDEVALRLASFLTASGVDAASTERVLRAWLVERGDPEFLKHWDALGIPRGAIVDTSERANSRRGRRRLIEEHMRP